jgi:hypothetical protein
MENKKQLAFQPENYRLLLIGLGINVLGFILMIGGASDDPNKFEESEIFSNVRITLAPMVILAGYLVIMYAIMRKSKKSKTQN